jgi:hypothetical protein
MRFDFAIKMQAVRPGDSMKRVHDILGSPDEVWKDSPKKVFGMFDNEQAWVYGVASRKGCPTLGRIYFSEGRVNEIFGASAPTLENFRGSEKELRKLMQEIWDLHGLYDKHFRCKQFIRVANDLIGLRHGAALDVLTEFVRVSPHHYAVPWHEHSDHRFALLDEPSVDEKYESVFLLLRGIFEAPQHPLIGSLVLSQDTRTLTTAEHTFRRYPLEIVDGTPYLISGPILRAMNSEDPDFTIENHLTYYRVYGSLRPQYSANIHRISFDQALNFLGVIWPKREKFTDVSARDIVAEAN